MTPHLEREIVARLEASLERTWQGHSHQGARAVRARTHTEKGRDR